MKNMTDTLHRHRRLMLRLVLGALIVSMLPLVARSEDQKIDQIENMRSILNEWVSARKATAEQRGQWAEGKEFLNNRIQLVQQEIDSLHEKIADLKKNITKADTKREDLQKENEKLEKSAGRLKQSIADLEKRTKQLLAQMPSRVQDHVQILAQQLPDDSDNTDMKTSTRFQNVLGIMNALNKFSRDITVASEIRDLGDDRSAEVSVMYLGLSRAYYVSANGELAGIGHSDGKTWTWTPDNQIAPQVSQAIAIFKNEQPASFVQIPVDTK